MTTQSRWEQITRILLENRTIDCDICPCIEFCDTFNADIGTALIDVASCVETVIAWASEEPVVPAPIWTDELPKEEGAYWYRDTKESTPYVATVAWAITERNVLWKTCNGYKPISSCVGQWSTRIPGVKE